MTPSAVPTATVARAPALQCVRIETGLVNKVAPYRAIFSFTFLSSLAIDSASSSSRSTVSGIDNPTDTSVKILIMRLTAQERFTAVGRVAFNSAATSGKWCSSDWPSRAIAIAPRTMPYAAAAPMAGAPRTSSLRIASATRR